MIYFIANANVTSGGPELLHQCCAKFNEFGYEAAIIYFSKFGFGVKPSEQVATKYGRYNCRVVKKIEDRKENTIVFSEGQWFFLPRFKHAKKVFWWLSVDNYFSSFSLSYAKLYAPFGRKSKKYDPFAENIIHCCQSEYAKLFLFENGIKDSNIIELYDYLSEEFLRKTRDEETRRKENRILYNPKKGIEFTQKLMEADEELEWFPLQNLTHEQMIEIMTTSKVYVDFGNHPGKDRIPREAAMCGCIVITGRRGSANNDVDIPIDDRYKIADKDENIRDIISEIKLAMNQYDAKRKDFDNYRKIIVQEEEEFNNQVKALAKMLVGSN